jgi:hypothetical protein
MSTPAITDLGSLLSLQRNIIIDNNPSDNTVLVGIRNNLNQLATVSDQGINDVRKLITQQSNMQEIVDNETRVLETKQLNMADDKVSKQREISLTNNSRKRTAEYNKMIMIIIGAMALSLAMNMLKDKITIVPEIIFNIATIIIVSIAGINVVRRYLDILSRSPSNYDELYLEPPAVDSADAIKQKQADAAKSGDLLGSIASAGCVGKACCDIGTRWDETKRRCVEAGGNADGFGNINPPAQKCLTAEPYSPSEYDNYSKIM